jgi:CheY-like chemotaxis protein
MQAFAEKVHANGGDFKTLASLPTNGMADLHPALVIGECAADLGLPALERPVSAEKLHVLMAALMARRADAMARIMASGLPFIPERRRTPRLDLDLSDPAQYILRRKPPPRGAVLIIDKGAAFRDHVARLVSTRPLGVKWTDSAPAALRLCDETPVAVVMVNTAATVIDPYQLCSAIKRQETGGRIAVVLMVSCSYPYDPVRARACGVRGLLDKPIPDHALVGALQRLMSLPA